MKKYFEQPELMVVHMNNNEIVTTSLRIGADITSEDGTIVAGSADRMGRESWDAGY